MSGSDDVVLFFRFFGGMELPGIRETSEDLQEVFSSLLLRFISSGRNAFQNGSGMESGVESFESEEPTFDSTLIHNRSRH